MQINLFKDQTKQIDAIINNLVSTIHKLLEQQETVRIALSGGKSPISLFHKLSTTKLPWPKINLTLVDERITDTSSIDSNENLVRLHLLKNLAENAHFDGLFLNSTDINTMIKLSHRWVEHIDIALLGMGKDGHTASIFPDCSELEVALDLTRPPSYIETNPISAKYTRIGLNLSALKHIKSIILSINGNTKLNVLKEANIHKNKNYPIGYLLNVRDDVHVFYYE